MTRTSVACITLGALAAATVLSVACSGDNGTSTPRASACSDPTQVSLPSCSVAGQDPFSDEACLSLDDRLARGAPTPDDARAPAILAPTEGERVPDATPYAIRWSAPTAWRPPAPRPMTLHDELARWTTLVPEADAHCASFNGRGYELTFRAGGETLLRRQQSAASWTPDAGAWSRLVAAARGREVQLTIVTANFSNSQVSTALYAQTSPRRFTLLAP
ncbi:MAG: hypothetical protein EPO40_25155 [Myxococcaceae bacterium]|nr:MAG: hypothetical protein EPO40_25155 [Myxococcaceae bacterium]